MSFERIALISDIHGNLTALEAVLEDIAARGIERIINLGTPRARGREVRPQSLVAARCAR